MTGPSRTLFIWALLAVGCGPVQSSTLIVDAAAELAAAETAEAPEFAPFEYTAAEAYLHKAREEQSYADFEVAVDYARKSRSCARVARALAEAKSKEKMGATRSTHTTRARCRPGPQRAALLPDAHEEPAVNKRSPAKALPKKEPKNKAKKTVGPKKPIVPKDPAEPEDPLPDGDEPLPEGDE